MKYKNVRDAFAENLCKIDLACEIDSAMDAAYGGCGVYLHKNQIKLDKKSRELTCNRVSKHHPLGKFLKSVCGFFVPSGYFPFPQQFLYFRRVGKRKAILVPAL